MIGVAELCNKQTNSHFTTFDEEMAMAFSSYCGLAILHRRLVPMAMLTSIFEYLLCIYLDKEGLRTRNEQRKAFEISFYLLNNIPMILQELTISVRPGFTMIYHLQSIIHFQPDFTIIYHLPFICSLMYKKVADAQYRSKLSNELMMYHMKVSL